MMKSVCTVYYYRLPKKDRDLTCALEEQRRLAFWVLKQAFWEVFHIRLEKEQLAGEPGQKPFYRPDVSRCFSISHCDEAVAVAVSDRPVGVDVEGMRRVRRKTVDKCCSQREKQYVFGREEGSGEELSEEAAQRFLRLWTLKESRLKMTGEGLRTAPNAVCFELPEDSGYGIIDAKLQRTGENAEDSVSYLMAEQGLAIAVTIQKPPKTIVSHNMKDWRVRMKKLKRIIFTAGVMLLLNLCATEVSAEIYDSYDSLTEEERYDSKYFQSFDEESFVDAVGADSVDADEPEAAVVAGLSDFRSEIDVSKYCLSEDEFSTFYFRLLNSHAELFYVKSEFNYRCDSESGCVLAVMPVYLMTAAEAKQGLIALDEAAEQALALVSDEMEDYEKALVIHDWLAVHCEYDSERLDAGNLPEISHSAYGALVNKIAVCDGYAQAYQYIMQNKLGIPCIQISSGGMKHAWNLLCLKERYYHVDVTWDDPCWDSIGRVTHENFLLSDTGITGTDHFGWDASSAADDVSFEDTLWDEINGSIIYYEGTWYYVDNGSGSLLKTDNLLSGTVTELFSLNNEWKASADAYYYGSFSYPQLYKKKLLFNGPKQIYDMELPTEEIETVYTPSEEELPADTDSLVYNIYGFKMEGNTMYYAVQPTPNLSSAQSSYIYKADLESTSISGKVTIEGEAKNGNILTANVEIGEGITGALTYQWYRSGVKIPGANMPQYLLTTEDVGRVISVAVTQEDFSGELRASVTVERMEDETPAPGDDGTETPSPGDDGTETPSPGGDGTKTPAPGGSGTEAPSSVTSAKGTVLAYNKAYYKITGSGSDQGTVEFLKPSVKTKSLTIPAVIYVDNVVYRVTSVAAKACKGNTKLTKVTVGANVKKIGKEAFSGCKKLRTITIKSAKLTSVGKNAVKNIKKNAVIHCPSKKVKAYKKLFGSKSGYKKTMKIK